MSVLSIPGVIRGGQVEKFGETCAKITATVGAAQSATGGTLVESMAGDRVVRTAQVGSVVCLGVAIHDQTAGNMVAVAMEGAWMLTATAAAIGAGNKVTVGAGGLIVVAGATPDARTLVGKALQDITSGGVGAVKISL